MCKKRDLILVEKYESTGASVGRHTFVVIDDSNGEIQGVSYDIVCNVLSSFKDEEQRKRKLSYPGNFPITASDTSVKEGNSKEGYIKADQFYYFKKEMIDYQVIGSINEEKFNLLMQFINDGNFDIIDITDNI